MKKSALVGLFFLMCAPSLWAEEKNTMVDFQLRDGRQIQTLHKILEIQNDRDGHASWGLFRVPQEPRFYYRSKTIVLVPRSNQLDLIACTTSFNELVPGAFQIEPCEEAGDASQIHVRASVYEVPDGSRATVSTLSSRGAEARYAVLYRLKLQFLDDRGAYLGQIDKVLKRVEFTQVTR
jgi:hypothetical protein